MYWKKKKRVDSSKNFSNETITKRIGFKTTQESFFLIHIIPEGKHIRWDQETGAE